MKEVTQFIRNTQDEEPFCFQPFNYTGSRVSTSNNALINICAVCVSSDMTVSVQILNHLQLVGQKPTEAKCDLLDVKDLQMELVGGSSLS